MIERIITTDACVAEGAAWLAQHDQRLASALVQTGPLPLRLKPDGFAALLDAIVAQQVSVAAARAIWGRVVDAGFSDPDNVLIASNEDLRACGLSRPKVRYARALAAARIDYASLRSMPSDQVVATLISVPGIGPWSAEIYAMFSLGRADVFAPGDLALQEAARVLFALDTRPSEKQLRRMAQDWSPWRGVAARLLWAYYRIIKQREGII
jgi:DNA-3-methyladenine glycosylase II